MMKVNLIPMAGQGKRFRDAGFDTPKPFIPVGGKPMVLQVIRHLPDADMWIFVVRPEHIKEYNVERLLKQAIPAAHIVVDPNPVGQLTSCLLARPEIPDESELFIAACDSISYYDKRRYAELWDDPAVDAVVWTFTQHESLQKNPAAWGWCELEADQQTVKRVSVKVPVSQNPFFDHAITATFALKRAGDFFRASDRMIARGEKINGELYVDAIPNFLKDMGKRSVIFDVDEYISFGTPDDLVSSQSRFS